MRISTTNIAPSKADIVQKISQFEQLALSYRAKGPQQLFLSSIKDVLHKLIKQKVSYSQISKAIFETYSFKVSPITISNFAVRELGIPKQPSRRGNSQNKTS